MPNATRIDRLAALERAAVRNLTNAELEALLKDAPGWLKTLSDGQLARLAQGGHRPVPGQIRMPLPWRPY
jgi:hypothetical protein